MFEIRLLGQFDIRYNGTELELQSRPAQSLLARLALTPGIAHRREKLAGDLWPDARERNARSNLRHALWRIRRALKGAGMRAPDARIWADAISMRLTAGDDVLIDAVELERVLDDPAASTEHLIAAAGLYRGELLPGFYEDWVGIERMRAQSAYEQVMQRLLPQLEGQNRWHEAVRWGLHWFAYGDDRESACCHVMRAHHALGNVTAVRTVYTRCVAVLNNQVGIPPSEETVALFHALERAPRQRAAPQPAPARGNTIAAWLSEQHWPMRLPSGAA